MRAAVTGGAGFIGSHLVRGLLARGHEVSVIDDFSSGSRERLAPFVGRVDVVEGSVLDRDALDAAIAGCEAVFHHAAIASVARSLADPRGTDEVNVGGTIEVMLAAQRHRVGRVVFAGSSAVYGNPAQLPCRETQRADPLSPYGVTKLAGEHYVHALGALHGVRTSVLRYFNVYGPGQDPASEYAAVIPRFIAAVTAGQRPTVNGSGEISRDFVFIDDVVEANVRAAAPSAPTGLTCNVASGAATTLLELLSAIARAAGVEVDPAFGPARAGDIAHSWADVTRAREQLGFGARVTFADGIAQTVAWFRDGRVLDASQ